MERERSLHQSEIDHREIDVMFFWLSTSLLKKLILEKYIMCKRRYTVMKDILAMFYLIS